jgi:hypothetical protein
VAERPVELTGENRLTQEEARVLLCASPWSGFNAAETQIYKGAMEKISRAREHSNRLRLHGGGQGHELSAGHRKLLHLIANNDGKPVELRGPREQELARELAALDLIETGPLGARVTSLGELEAKVA